jgi:hypothetical protein
MHKVKKEFVGKVSVSIGTETIVLNEDTDQETLEILASDENAKCYIEKSKPETKTEDGKLK